MTIEHTAGPWDISRDATPAWHYQASIIHGGDRVATAFQSAANAALIAAAPELLAACMAAEGVIDSMLDREDNPGARAVRLFLLTTIAKAEGRT